MNQWRLNNCSLSCIFYASTWITPPDVIDLVWFDFSVRSTELWCRLPTTLAKAFVAPWDRESETEGKKRLKCWKDTRRWNPTEEPGITTHWTPAGEDTWRWTAADTPTPSGTISLSPDSVKWVLYVFLTVSFKYPSEKYWEIETNRFVNNFVFPYSSICLL